MLVLSRRLGEKIVIGDDIVVTVVEVHRDSVRLGIDAPKSVAINRAELLAAIMKENQAATLSDAQAAVALESLKGISGLAKKPAANRKPEFRAPKLPRDSRED